jgi:RNA polymerase sigma factor (sigma-70 family)
MQAPPPAAHAIWFDKFAATYRDLLRFLHRRTGNDDDARDLAHDTWLRLAEHERSLGHEPPADLRAYLFTVAHHLALDHLRRRKLALGHTADHAPIEPDVADGVMYRQAIQAVEAALQELPPRARDVFLQHRLMGIGQAELAQRHGLSRNMIERDVMLAMDRVQAAIERWRGDEAAGAARKGRRRSIAALLGVAGLCASGSLAWQLWRSEVPQWRMALATRRGQTLRQSLPDGSVLTLDAMSSADVMIYALRRSVALHLGAAFFDVAHNADRPFVVVAGSARITVLGTRFGVELGGGHVDAQVEAGRVEIQALNAQGGPAAEPVVLGVGQALRVAHPAPAGDATPYRALPTVNPDAVAAWRQGVLQFDATPLVEAVQRLTRYADATVTVAPEVAALPVSGQVRVSQAQDWLAALPAALPVRVSPRGDGWHIAGR